MKNELIKKYDTIKTEGNLLTLDIINKIENAEEEGQKKITKDEILKAWVDVQDFWKVFKRKKDESDDTKHGTTETRNIWMLPILSILGYDAKTETKHKEINNEKYPISHFYYDFPISIVSFKQDLDKKATEKRTPHGNLQEYINLTECLYGIVTNGLSIRLLRNSIRLIKLNYLQFDIERMLEENNFADFAVFYRIMHARNMPKDNNFAGESLIEKYHQNSLESGARIREGLSEAVKKALECFGNGFLKNRILIENYLESNDKIAFQKEFFKNLLHLIYKILFLVVVEERDLIFNEKKAKKKRDIYYNYYSINKIRRFSQRPHTVDKAYHDYWILLQRVFQIFEDENCSKIFNISPLGGIFKKDSIGILDKCTLDNRSLAESFEKLSMFESPINKQKIKVNYAGINVEEFGSVYEELLEYEPNIIKKDMSLKFELKKTGEDRATSGTHYTPDDMVKPLIKNSLEHIINQKLKEPNPEKALLSIKVCDVACGSGHILLNIARKITTSLIKVRTGEEGSKEEFRKAIKDVIKNCVYGVDINPLAVELCKISLWIESFNTNEPLSFLDHHIKCGNSIIGIALNKDLENIIPKEAFKKLNFDDKDIAKYLRDLNTKEIKFYGKDKMKWVKADATQTVFDFNFVNNHQENILQKYKQFLNMPENTREEVEAKKEFYNSLEKNEMEALRKLADIYVAPFFIPKIQENKYLIATTGDYTKYCLGKMEINEKLKEKAKEIANNKRFFHWFLEFPEIFAKGGFDAIISNPPFLGGQALSGKYGHEFLNWVKYEFSPAGSCDMVTYFLRRSYDIIKNNGFNALVTTNSICEGAMREGGLAVILQDKVNKSLKGEIKGKANIIFAKKSLRWTGKAKLYVSLFSLIKGNWQNKCNLDEKEVNYISEYLTTGEEEKVYKLEQNKNLIFQGSIFLGEGFLLTHEKAKEIINKDEKNKDVIFPVINGQEVNNEPEQKPQRSIINFFDWSEEKASQYEIPYQIVKEKVKPFREKNNRKSRREKWWIYGEHNPGLVKKIASLERCFVIARTTKYLNFSVSKPDKIFTHNIFVFIEDSFAKYCILQSTIHEIWARKYSYTLCTTLSYAPTNCFETFPFPENLKQYEEELQKIGQQYHDFRKEIMLKLWLGLTKIYNLFHDKNLSIELIETISKKDKTTSEQGYKDLLKLRELHVEMDKTVLKAYGFNIDLSHDFYEVDYLPENDRSRFTIKPDSRIEILKKLLELNHKIYKTNFKNIL